MFHLAFVATLLTIVIACQSQSSDNLRDQPKKWCSLSASLSTGQRPCDLDVEEIFTVPWIPNALSRVLITPMGRIDLKNIVGLQVINGTHVPVVTKHIEAGTETLRINVTLEAAQPTVNNAQFILRYTVINGLRIFDRCSEDDNKFEGTSGTMIAMWQPGVVSPYKANKLNVAFRLPHQHVLLNPPPFGVPSARNKNLVSDKTTIIQFNETTTHHGTTAFYVRFTPRTSSDVAKCSGYRMCKNEFRANRETPPKASSMSIRLWLAVGCSLLLAAFVVALIVVCCLRRGKAAEENDSADASQHSVNHHPGAGGFREKEENDCSPRVIETEEVYIRDVTSANAGGTHLGRNIA